MKTEERLAYHLQNHPGDALPPDLRRWLLRRCYNGSLHENRSDAVRRRNALLCQAGELMRLKDESDHLLSIRLCRYAKRRPPRHPGTLDRLLQQAADAWPLPGTSRQLLNVIRAGHENNADEGSAEAA